MTLTIRHAGRFALVPALVLACTISASAAQNPAAALKALTVETSASPELVGMMAKELSISPGQAQGAAGALLGLAKTKLKPEEFGEVGKAIPGIDGLLKAAPSGGMMGSALSGTGAAGLAGLAGSFNQLGLDPSMAMKAAPLLSKFVSGKGAAGAATLLAGALK